MKYISETGRHRSTTITHIEEYFGNLDKLNGIDIGFGGDPILQNSICMDQPYKYTSNVIQTTEQQLFGDARNLYWFNDNCLDYVYSAHVLEDFREDEILDVFREWLRIVRVGGLLILDLPHELKYREVCRSRGYRSNPRHQILNMSPEYILKLTANENVDVEFIKEDLPPDYYSFLIGFSKC